MNEKELRAEIFLLRKIVHAAAREAKRRDALVDKITAARLRLDLLVKKLKGVK